MENEVQQTAFSNWGQNFGFDESWTISQLDNLAFSKFLIDFLPHFPLKTTDHLKAFIHFGGSLIKNDQSALYKYLFPQDLPYKNWSSKLIESVMSDEEFPRLCQYIEKVKTKKTILNSCNVFMRHALYDVPYLKDLHRQITPLVEKSLERKLNPTYSYLSMYGENGICPPHRDKPECQWTLDLCVKQDRPWLLSIENRSFLMNENEGLIYSGTDQLHWRDKIHPNGFCDLVFFHFKQA
jgi:hypothetical protein